MTTNHTPTRPSPTQELSRLTARVAELEATLLKIETKLEQVPITPTGPITDAFVYVPAPVPTAPTRRPQRTNMWTNANATNPLFKTRGY